MVAHFFGGEVILARCLFCRFGHLDSYQVSYGLKCNTGVGEDGGFKSS